jgi:hypothetical protein
MAEGTQDYVLPTSAVPAGLLLFCYVYPGFHPGLRSAVPAGLLLFCYAYPGFHGLSSTVPAGLFRCGGNLDKLSVEGRQIQVKCSKLLQSTG